MDMTDSECYPHHHIKLRKWEFHTIHKLDSHNFFKSSSEDIFFSLLLGGEEGRERNIDVREKYWLVPSRTGSDQRLYTPRLGNQTHNLGMCIDQKSNVQPVSYKTMLQPTEPHWPELDYHDCLYLFNTAVYLFQFFNVYLFQFIPLPIWNLDL